MRGGGGQGAARNVVRGDSLGACGVGSVGLAVRGTGGNVERESVECGAERPNGKGRLPRRHQGTKETAFTTDGHG